MLSSVDGKYCHYFNSLGYLCVKKIVKVFNFVESKNRALKHRQASPFEHIVSDTDVIRGVGLHPNQIVVLPIWLAF